MASGQDVIIPTNMLIDLPANRLTLRQLFEQAPAACLALGETGLARADACVDGGPGGMLTAVANLTRGFQVIAGEALVSKGPSQAGLPVDTVVSGIVTFLDYTDGFLRINGIPGSPLSGTIIRLNDPDSVHTIQQGLGCDATMPNCSADVRFTGDLENYTFNFATGYPLCIPSTHTGGARTTASNLNGIGDPFCPFTNRSAHDGLVAVADSTRFAPLRLGDSISAEGNFEVVDGVVFFSAHTLGVPIGLTTADHPSQPDYAVFAEAEADAPGFANGRAKNVLIGFSTLTSSQLDIFGMHVDPSTGISHEIPWASTVGNPADVCQGLGGGGLADAVLCNQEQGGGIWKIIYDVDFQGGVNSRRSPCTHLFNAGLMASPFCTLAEEFSVLSPIARELLIRTRHKSELAPGVITVDINGREAPNGEYLNPLLAGDIGHPEFDEIGLGLLTSPFLFTGEPWLMDRRLGPGGCDGPCESLASHPLGSLALDPFPYSEFDPRQQSQQSPIPFGAENEMFAHWPFGPSDLLSWPPPPSVLPPSLVCDDGNPCTDDTCDPVSGCVFTANDTNSCDDGDACSLIDLCSAGKCLGTVDGCACMVSSLVSPLALPSAGQVVDVQVVLDTSVTTLGSYTIELSWDSRALRLDIVLGGTQFEFSTPPLCNTDNLGGTATCTGVQIASSSGPAGRLHVATLRMSILDDTSGLEHITLTPMQAFDTQGTAIDLCNTSETLTLATLCGDVTGDSQINVVDAMMVAQSVVGLRECPSIPRFDLCDVSSSGASDGECTIGDALRMVQCGVGLIPCEFSCSPITCVSPVVTSQDLTH